jgi:SWI/SNF-related matrix-associated actin-dependent regulator of chromatin subfamily A-like protein 1
MSEIDFGRLSLADYAQLFQIGAVADSRRELLISLSADLDVLVSGRTYEYRERIKEIARESKTAAFWDGQKWVIRTRRLPNILASVLGGLAKLPDARLALKPEFGKRQAPKVEIPPLGSYQPFPFQIEGISVVVETFRRGLKSFLLADEMGLGKTIQALGVAKVLGLETVVIAPASVIPSWQEKAQECGIAAEVFSYAKADRAKATGKLLILDEAHYIKNKRAQRTKAVRRLVGEADKVLALTGTPILNRLEELAVILEVIGIIKSANAFLHHYTSTFVHEFWVNDQLITKHEYYLTPQQEQELKLLLKTKLPYLRRLKSEVWIQLPRKNRTPIPLNINASRATEFLRKAAQEFAEKRRIDIGKYKTDEALVSFIFEHYNHLPISTARRLYAIDKAPLAAEYIKYLTDGLKAPLVVFYHHKEVLDILQERIPGPYIDGSVPQWRRGELVREFQEEKYQVLYLSITAAGLGITLTAADTAVFVEYDWVPANLLQAEDRINRIGQKSEVTYYHYLTTKDPIERLILEKILEKVALAEAVLGGQSGLKETLKNV